MNYVDTHCHLNFPQYREDMEEVISRALDLGVGKIINVGTDLATSKASINLASRYSGIYASVGIHPHDARHLSAEVLADIEKLANEPKVVAIGEIGLDYFRNLSARGSQEDAFAKQLQIAARTQKPIIIHCRDAYRDVLGILDEHYIPNVSGRSPGVIHSFSSGVQHLQEFLKRGFYVGFNAMITYPKNSALIESVKATPLSRILLETDAPFLPIQDKRGQRNEPAAVVDVAHTIAQIKGITADEVARATSSNAQDLFGLQ